MYTVAMTGHEDMWARGEGHVLDYALDYTRERGPYSGMEDWDEDDVTSWIRAELEATGRLDLYISGPQGYEFTVTPNS